MTEVDKLYREVTEGSYRARRKGLPSELFVAVNPIPLPSQIDLPTSVLLGKIRNPPLAKSKRAAYGKMMRISEQDWFALRSFQKTHKLTSKSKAVKLLLIFYAQNRKKEDG